MKDSNKANQHRLFTEENFNASNESYIKTKNTKNENSF